MSTETYETAIGPAAAARERPLLRRALQLDAVVTGANGVAYLVAAGLLDGPLGLSSTLLRVAGAVLVVFAAAVWVLSSRPAIPGGPVAAVIGINVIWALDSVLALAVGWVDPTTLGGVWIVLQALVVAAFAGLQDYARGR